jgi:hypothetical protein
MSFDSTLARSHRRYSSLMSFKSGMLEENRRCTSTMLLDSRLSQLHNAVVRFVTGEAVIDLEEYVAGDQAGTVLSDPHSSQVKFSTHVCRHGVIWKFPGFSREVLEYRTEELKLFDDFFI